MEPDKTSGEPDLPPGTFRYIDNKKKWIRALEICGIIVVATIPVVLSFYQADYSIARVYQVINPSDIGTLPNAYKTWGGFVKATKQLIQPAATPTQVPISLTPVPSGYPTAQPTQSTNQTSEPQNQEFIYPNQTFDQTPQAEETTYPTSSPTPTPTSEPTPTDEYVNPAIAACYGKDEHEKCSYVSPYGYMVQGRCTSLGGSLVCMSFSY